MSANTKIEWAHHTFNAWIGCTKLTAACDHCYAETWAKRTGNADLWNGARRRTTEAYWRQPLKWDRLAREAGERHRVFCCSMADVFDNQADEVWRADLWKLIAATPNLYWLLLTKRPQNIAKMLPADWGGGYPNVWLGTTVENQTEADRRIPHLLAVPAHRRFLSCEPLLSQIWLKGTSPDGKRSWNWLTGETAVMYPEGPDFEYGPKLDWVICGGESGAGARPMHPDWARSLRDQCASSGVAFHFKQWGEWVAGIDRDRDDHDWRLDYGHQFADRGRVTWLNLEGGRGFHGARFHVMARVGKADAGRLLDGIQHDGVPS